MDELEILLDTPKRNRLQTELGTLRTDLKTFERTFADTHGRKPRQSDIKNDRDAATRYKRYHRLQDLFAGKKTFEELDSEPKQNKSGKRENTRNIRGGHISKGSNNISTPRKARLDEPHASSSPQLALASAVGPTPHRDGKVLGLFDLLQRSGSATSSKSPSSSTRKRKIEELYLDTPVQRSPFKTVHSQAQRSDRKEGDLLEFLTGTPQKMSTSYGNAKHSRTPRSDCRKFALSQLFATPSTQRFLNAAEEEATQNTPLRSLVLGVTPSKDLNNTGLDTTPAYLKRSTSFKDRLLSAASSPALKDDSKPVSSFKSVGPPTLRHFRSSTSNILAQNDASNSKTNSQDDFDQDEDDWAALRELDRDSSPVGIADNRSPNRLNSDPILPETGGSGTTDPPRYKKKGQKRTTKKSNIRPVQQRKTDEPHFVAADGDSETDNDDEGFDKNGTGPLLQNGTREKDIHEKSEGRNTCKTGTKKQKVHGMINPNAQSHQNFRSLKIKNKNSKANGNGRGRFAKSRR